MARRGALQSGVLYAAIGAVDTVWDSHQSFLDWTHSDAFRKAHAQRGSSEGLMLSHPRFQGWQGVDLAVKAT